MPTDHLLGEVGSSLKQTLAQVNTGIISEFPVSRALGDAKVLEIVEGTSEIQRMIISRELPPTSTNGRPSGERIYAGGAATDSSTSNASCAEKPFLRERFLRKPPSLSISHVCVLSAR